MNLGKTTLDALVALLAILAVGVFVYFGITHKPALALGLGIPLLVGAIAAFNWLGDNDQQQAHHE